jgi:hypothetical protein
MCATVCTAAICKFLTEQPCSAYNCCTIVILWPFLLPCTAPWLYLRGLVFYMVLHACRSLIASKGASRSASSLNQCALKCCAACNTTKLAAREHPCQQKMQMTGKMRLRWQACKHSYSLPLFVSWCPTWHADTRTKVTISGAPSALTVLGSHTI